MKGSLFTQKTAAALIAVFGILYITFTALQYALPQDPIFIKYACVLLCLFATGGLLFVDFANRDARLLAAAMLFTAISDYFLLIANAHFEVGLATFIAVQTVYAVRLNFGKRLWFVSAAVRIAAAAALITALCAAFGTELILIEVCIYFVMLSCNLADALISVKNSWQNAVFAVGLLLFLCCDICVGLYNAGGVLGMRLPQDLIDFAAQAMWIFYAPSQILIVLSQRNGGLIMGEMNERKIEENS